MTNKTYDTLKFIAQIVLPSLGTLYFALSGIWGFPYGEQIVGTIARRILKEHCLLIRAPRLPILISVLR